MVDTREIHQAPLLRSIARLEAHVADLEAQRGKLLTTCVDAKDVPEAIQIVEGLLLRDVEMNELIADHQHQFAEIARRVPGGHFCQDWDQMYMHRGSVEWSTCVCFRPEWEKENEGDAYIQRLQDRTNHLEERLHKLRFGTNLVTEDPWGVKMVLIASVLLVVAFIGAAIGVRQCLTP